MSAGKEVVIQTAKEGADYASKNQSYHEGGNQLIQHATASKEQPNESGGFTKRIGSTTYRVSVHFSRTSKETMSDKILRMIQNESVSGKEARK